MARLQAINGLSTIHLLCLGGPRHCRRLLGQGSWQGAAKCVFSTGAVVESPSLTRFRSVGPAAYTTFWVGCVSDVDGSLPTVNVLFNVSYGLDRTALEELNFIITSGNPVTWNKMVSAKLPLTVLRLTF